MILTFKTQLKTDNYFNQYLSNCCRTRRFCYNKSLEIWKMMLDNEEKPNAFSVTKFLRKEIKEEGKYKFLRKYPNMVMENAIFDLDKSFQMFFKSKKVSRQFPRFKKWGQCVESFRIHKKNDTTFLITENGIRIPNLPEGYLLRLHEELPSYINDIRTITVSKKIDKWYISISYYVEYEEYNGHIEDKVGIDLGLKTFAVTSKNEQFFLPVKQIKSLEKKISKKQSMLSKRTKGSHRHSLLKKEIARLYEKKSNILKDFLHKLSAYICSYYKNICIEDLNVSGLLKNHKLARTINRSAWYMFKEMLKYKCEKYGSSLRIAGRFFPSSKTCSCCGNKKEKLRLNERIYHCEQCGSEMDRDFNASKNLEFLLAEI